MQEREDLSRWRQEPQDWYQPAPLWWVLVNTEKWDSRRYSSIECVRWEAEQQTAAQAQEWIKMHDEERHRLPQIANKAEEALFWIKAMQEGTFSNVYSIDWID